MRELKVPFPIPLLTINDNQIEFPSGDDRATLALGKIQLTFELSDFANHVIIVPPHDLGHALSAKAATPNSLMTFERSEADGSKGHEQHVHGRHVRFTHGVENVVKVTYDEELLIAWTMTKANFEALLAENKAEGALSATLVIEFEAFSDAHKSPGRLTVMDEFGNVRDATIVHFETKRVSKPA